jgi:hypothetical protein
VASAFRAFAADGKQNEVEEYEEKDEGEDYDSDEGGDCNCGGVVLAVC